MFSSAGPLRDPLLYVCGCPIWDFPFRVPAQYDISRMGADHVTCKHGGHTDGLTCTRTRTRKTQRKSPSRYRCRRRRMGPERYASVHE
eukprot:3516516-Prymnesium_polylepis.1